MDKNAIKKFAVWARTELIARVSLKGVEYGITEGNIEDANVDSVGGKVLTVNEKKQRQALIAEINDKGYKQVMEEVAYTWFNRFSALRFMEVNGYLPSHVRVFTDEENNFKPQIITEAIHLDLDGLDMEKVYELKDAEKTEELYKYLLIVQCNALNKILPGMFQKIADYTELLLPDNLLREGSVIQQMIELIPEDDWKDAVQIIGWLYQYYNSEKKDDVFAALKKNVKITKENIPAATQLFTPDWIVRYMVENSLGRLWLEGHPDVKEQLLPTEEEQFEVYKRAAVICKNKVLTIRTLDIGGDKDIPYMGLTKESNPFLGYRAIRFCLGRIDVFTTQLRAILRASAYGNIRIMLPLITGVSEVRSVRTILQNVMRELDSKEIPYDKDILLGVMIETPAACMLADILAKEADFFSIGTNDLTQYTIAVDRGNENVAYLYSAFHPAVLRSVKRIIECAKRENIEVGMCGEAAGNPAMIPLLLAFGLDEFSVTASKVLETRKNIASWTMKEAAAVTDTVMGMSTEKEVSAYLSDYIATKMSNGK